MKITTTKIIKAESGPYMVEYDEVGSVWIIEEGSIKTEISSQPDDILALAGLLRAVADLMKSAEVSR